MSAPELEAARLRVALDVRHPLAYLALGPTLAFGRELGTPIDWVPLEVPPLRPPSAPAPGDDRGIRHRRSRARAIAREIATYGAAQGLVLHEPYRDGSAEAAHRAWLWVRGRSRPALEPFLRELFRGYWARELDAASPDALAVLVELFGAGGREFRAWYDGGGRAASDTVATTLREQGLFQVPAYVVEDEVFYGRQHLPMIRWILEGRSGPVPI